MIVDPEVSPMLWDSAVRPLSRTKRRSANRKRQHLNWDHRVPGTYRDVDSSGSKAIYKLTGRWATWKDQRSKVDVDLRGRSRFRKRTTRNLLLMGWDIDHGLNGLRV
jgi:hypothetical protein